MIMQFITGEIEKRFKQIGKQENSPDPIVVIKFFHPKWDGKWYATEYNPVGQVFFGYVINTGKGEWKHFSVEELEALCFPILAYCIEVDRRCGIKPISEHCPELKEEIEKEKGSIA